MSNQLILKELAELLLARHWRLVTAESCTGGGIGAAVTEIPGSSEWFECGFITYSNASKQRLLGVSAERLADQGAVSQAVARKMALGALQASGAEVSVAVTGIAGPGGGTADKPVGTVWIAWAVRADDQSGEHAQANMAVQAQCFHFVGSREDIRAQTVAAALQGLVAQLED